MLGKCGKSGEEWGGVWGIFCKRYQVWNWLREIRYGGGKCGSGEKE